MATVKTVTIQANLSLDCAKGTINVDLSRFKSPEDLQTAVSTCFASLLDGAVANSKHEPDTDDTLKRLRARFDSLIEKPAGGTRVSDPIRDMLRDLVVAQKLAKRTAANELDAEGCAKLLSAEVIGMAGKLLNADATRVAALQKIAKS
jgi:hypothetical protein